MTEQIIDQAIINRLFERDEDAIRLLSSKYDAYLQKIAWNILANQEDCEECRNDTYLKVWNSIPPNRPKNLKAYLAKLMRNTALDRYKEKTRLKRVPSEYTVSMEELEESIPSINGVEDEFQKLQFKRVFDEFIENLPKRQKYIFICRYYCQDKISDIARSLKLSESMILRELTVIREKLKETLEEERYL